MATIQTVYYVPTLAGLGTTVAISACISTCCIAIYEVCRRMDCMASLFVPRTMLVRNPAPALSPRLFSFLDALFLPNSYYLKNTGLDSALYLQFLMMCIHFLTLACLLVLPILLPLHWLSDITPFDMHSTTTLSHLNVSNVPDGSLWLWAHCILTYFVSLTWIWLLYTNYWRYLDLFRVQMALRTVKGDVTARTVMVQNVPHELRNDTSLKGYFASLGVGDVETVNIVRTAGKLERKLKRRQLIIDRVERACVRLGRNVIQRLEKRRGRTGVGKVDVGRALVFQDSLPRDESLLSYLDKVVVTTKQAEDAVVDTSRQASTVSNGQSSITLSSTPVSIIPVSNEYNLWTILLLNAPPQSLLQYQPTHSQSFTISLPAMEKHNMIPSKLKPERVVSIPKYLESLTALTGRIEELRDSEASGRYYRPTSTAFVTFVSWKSAQLCAQGLTCWKPNVLETKMAPEPRDILWTNLMRRGRRGKIIGKLRDWLVFGAVWSLTIFWLFPISFILGLTSLEALSQHFEFLDTFKETSSVIRSFIQNVLPTMLVTLFMSMLPWILCLLSKQQGFKSYSDLEDCVLRRYYHFAIFNVLIVFLLGTTFLTTILNVLYTPTSIIQLLAESLPQGANFFLNFILFNSCTHAMELAQLGTQLFGRLLALLPFVSPTPRIFVRKSIPWSFPYYYYYPNHILIFVIVLTYSVIQPLILLFGLMYFTVALVVFKHQFAYAYIRRYEANGLYYRRMVRYTTDGLLIFQLTMVGLLYLKKAFPCASLVTPLVLFTAWVKLYFHRRFQSRCKYLAIDVDEYDEVKAMEKTDDGMGWRYLFRRMDDMWKISWFAVWWNGARGKWEKTKERSSRKVQQLLSPKLDKNSIIDQEMPYPTEPTAATFAPKVSGSAPPAARHLTSLPVQNQQIDQYHVGRQDYFSTSSLYANDEISQHQSYTHPIFHSKIVDSFMLPRDPSKRLWRPVDCIDINIDKIVKQYYDDILADLEGGNYSVEQKMDIQYTYSDSQEDLHNSYDTVVVHRVDTTRTNESEKSATTKRRSRKSIPRGFNFRNSHCSDDLAVEIELQEGMNQLYELETEEVSSGDEE